MAALMPCLNEEASVDWTLGTIFAGTRLPDEIIVADGGSTDATLARIRAFEGRGVPITIVDNPGVLPGAGRNRAAEATDADIFLGLDFGNGYDRRYIEKMVRPFEDDPRIGHVIGRFRPVPRSAFERCLAVVDYTRMCVAEKMTRAEMLAYVPEDRKLTAGMVVAWRRDVYLGAGGQPEWLRAAEDVLFGQRIIEQGVEIFVEPDALVEHHMRKGLGEFFRMRRSYTLGRVRAGLPRRPMLVQVGHFWLAAAALVAGLFALPLLAVAAVLFAAYIARNVIRPFLRVDGRLPGASDVATGLSIAVARDLAITAGLARGLWDWYRDPQWRDKLSRYMDLGAV